MRNINIRKLHIENRSPQQLLTYYIFLFPFFFGLLLGMVGLPNFLKYTIDAAWVGILLLALRRKTLFLDKRLMPLLLLVCIFFLYTLVSYLCHYQFIGYYLWGLRNNFRFYIAFFAFAAFFTEEDVEKCYRFLYAIFWINVLVSLVQFFVLGYQQDYLGGVFGVERGSNAYSMVFFCIVLTRSLLSMMNGDEKLGWCLLRCASAAMIAVLSELFAFFLFFAVIAILATACTKFSWRKCLLYIALVLIFSVCGTLLVELFGEGSGISFETIVNRMFSSNYATEEDLGRMTAIPTIAEDILRDGPSRLFGLGLGNCDTSSFDIFNKPFFKTHENLHYVWILSAFLFLETGFVGLLLHMSFFVLCLIFAIKQMKRGGNILHCQITVVMSIVCIILTFYNASLRTEAGYCAFLTLALPFVQQRRQTDADERTPA